MSLKIILMTAGCASLLAPVSALAQSYDYDWTGFYVGANAGASWGDTSLHSRVEQGGGIVIIPPAERDLINADRVKIMKRGAVLLNFAREGIVDNQAVVDGLNAELADWITALPTPR